MPVWLWYVLAAMLFFPAATAIYFFTLTRGALLMRKFLGSANPRSGHVYPLYSNPELIRLIDFQPLIAAILLFQYPRLVKAITDRIARTDLSKGPLLFTSCAFGNVMPKVVEAAEKAGVPDVLVVDIIDNELTHARKKLQSAKVPQHYTVADAAALDVPNDSVQANVIFFLLHELPNAAKPGVLQEAVRVLAPGGKLYLAEFHRPTFFGMRMLSWLYFKVFEPWALALWGSHDPVEHMEATGLVTCERQTFFLGNFQLIVATKK